MTMMPPRSSATANVARNTFSDSGTRLPNTDRTPNEKAMSVAIGTASPRNMVGSSGHTSQNTATGTSIPPQAPIKGNSALRGEASSPTRISRLIYSPTDKKKMAMKKSLIRSISVME